MSKELHYRFRLDLIESPVLLRRIPHRAEEDTVRLAERVLKGPDVIQALGPHGLEHPHDVDDQVLMIRRV